MGNARRVAEGDPRRRIVWTLVAGVGLGSTGSIAAGTVATIVARDIAGTTAWSGAPGASVVLGSALGSTLLSALMVRRGRRAGLTLGYAIGFAGAVLAVAAVAVRSLPLLLVGTVMIGFGNSANLLSRYTAADMFPEARRASAIATVVWGATIGAIVGPNLLAFSVPVAAAAGLPDLAGPYLVPAVFVGAAALLSFSLLRPDPYQLAHEVASEPARPASHALPTEVPLPAGEPRAARVPGSAASGAAGASDASDAAGVADGRPAASLLELLQRPTVLVAIVALIVGQIVMTLIMTMTPLHMTEHGHGLDAVGFVISAHVLGMYALSPLSGMLTNRLGSPPVMLLGLATLSVAGVTAAIAPPDGGAVLLIALFLLGYGWNLGFVAGSALLATGLALRERARLEGASDALIWSSAAAASLSSGVVVAAASYTALGLIAALLVIGPAFVLLSRRRALAGA